MYKRSMADEVSSFSRSFKAASDDIEQVKFGSNTVKKVRTRPDSSALSATGRPFGRGDPIEAIDLPNDFCVLKVSDNYENELVFKEIFCSSDWCGRAVMIVMEVVVALCSYDDESSTNIFSWRGSGTRGKFGLRRRRTMKRRRQRQGRPLATLHVGAADGSVKG